MTNLIPQDLISVLASKYAVSAGGISMVLGNVKRIASKKGNVEELIDKLMKKHCQLMGTHSRNDFIPAKDYSLEGLNIKGDIALDKIVCSVQRYIRDVESETQTADSPRMNLLLWGPPGSGKTEFVKYLGSKTGRRVIVKKGSDLLDKFVGETEERIRDAFKKAESENAILFFDEIDGIIQNRANAQRSWEVTQVNELLQQMEEFKGVMVAATNFFENLDSAAMRRFTFKLQFDYLNEIGKKHFFEHMFRTLLTHDEEEELNDIAYLCPGDFRTARQSLYYLSTNISNHDYLEALRRESSVKSKTLNANQIGFF